MFMRDRGLRSAVVGGALTLVLTLPGCRKEDRSTQNCAPGAIFAGAAKQASDLHLAYSHEISIGLPPGQVAPHFTAARDRCLNDAALHCMLLEASIEQEARSTLCPSAHLNVRLPHDAVEPFSQALIAPLPGEHAGDAVVRSRATRADDLSRTIADNGRRLAQLTDFRNRLTALAARPDTSVDGLIKIAGSSPRCSRRSRRPRPVSAKWRNG